MPENETLTITEVMGYLKVARPTVYRLIKEGELEAIKIGHNYRILKGSWEKFIHDRKEPKAATR